MTIALVCLSVIALWIIGIVLFCIAWYRLKEVGGREDDYTE